MNATTHSDAPWLRRCSFALVAATFVLIFLGGQVKSHEAGLSVPDWPTSYGQNMLTFPISEWNGGIFYEQLHRVFAFSVGVLSVILCIWLAIVESRRWVKVLGFFAVIGVIAQGVLGGLTVLFVQPAWLSSMHAVVAQSFFVLVIFLAYTQSRERAQREQDSRLKGRDPSTRPILIVAALVFIQLIVGAFMRHTESGLAIPDFPLMAGQIVPWFTSSAVEWVNTWRVDYAFETGVLLPEVTLGQIWIHFVHRVGAILIVAAVLNAVVQALRNQDASPEMWPGTFFLAALVAVQFSLGMTTVLTQKLPIITSMHVVIGAATLGYVTLLVFRALPLSLRADPSAQDNDPLAAIPAQKVQT